MVSPGKGTIAFTFSAGSGHVNPSLPIARRLVELGYNVMYMCGEQLRVPIEATGATYVDKDQILFGGVDGLDFFNNVAAELGLTEGLANPDTHPVDIPILMLHWRKALPPMLSWLREITPILVVFDSIACGFVRLAADVLGIPTASLLTINGHGLYEDWCRRIAALAGFEPSADGILAWHRQTPAMNHPSTVENARILAEEYDVGIEELIGMPLAPSSLYSHTCNLVSTIESLAIPIGPRESEVLAARGYEFHYVGPLVGDGTARASTQVNIRSAAQSADDRSDVAPDVADGLDAPFPMDRVRQAHAEGRPLVMCSLGTVITSDLPRHYGWAHRAVNPFTGKAGATGKEFSQAIWRALFLELGRDNRVVDPHADEPLLIVSVGYQSDALEGLSVPGNAICRGSIPQVELLAMRPHVFVTHAGQNSIMESLRMGVPMLTVPRQHDQPSNADRLEMLGAAVAVAPPEDGTPGCLEAYTSAVRAGLRRVLHDATGERQFAACAARIGAEIRSSGGVGQAVELLIAAIDGAT